MQQNQEEIYFPEIKRKFHSDSDPGEIEFKMEILSSHKSVSERQLIEAVLIERNLGLFSMNSKLEYSHTVIPTIKIKMGNRSEKEDPHVVREKDADEKIKKLRKYTFKKNTLEKGPQAKRSLRI